MALGGQRVSTLRAYGGPGPPQVFAPKTAPPLLGDVIVATVESLEPARTAMSVTPVRSVADLMVTRTVEKL